MIMTLCIVSPRFHPAIGGVETYLKNITTFCSKYIKTIIVTSNLKSTIGLFEKRQYLKRKHELISHNIEIIRANTLRNTILRTLFNFNEFLNNRLETFFDKFLNPILYEFNYIGKLNKKISTNITKGLLFQRFFKNPNFLQIYYILKKIHNNQKIQIIHSAPLYLTANIGAFYFSKKYNVPFICTPFYHINPYINNILCPSHQYILKNADAIIACTNLEKEFYCKYGINRNKIHIIPPGIKPNNYNIPNVKKFKEKWNIPENAPLILFMARRTYKKGFPQAIYALKHLIKKFKNIKLMIVGPTTREYNSFYKKLPSNLKAHIIDLGLVDEDTKTDVLASCDIFLMPSLDDAFGIVYLESWLFKKPVIGASEGNVAGLIDNNKNGFLISFNNIKNIALKIEILLKNEKKRVEFGQNGYNKLINNYILEITNKKILNLYKEFI